MNTYNFGHFFEDNNILTIPNIGTLEVNKITPRFDMPTNTFEPPKLKPYFSQDLNQSAGDSWFALNKYLNTEDAKKEKEAMILAIDKGTGLHINGIGTLVKMPLEGYDFIPEIALLKFAPPLPSQIYLNENRSHTIYAGTNSYSNTEMTDLLNAPPPKKSYFWLWVTLAMVLIAAAGVGYYFYKNGLKF
jgi:hypothetical protein